MIRIIHALIIVVLSALLFSYLFSSNLLMYSCKTKNRMLVKYCLLLNLDLENKDNVKCLWQTAFINKDFAILNYLKMNGKIFIYNDEDELLYELNYNFYDKSYEELIIFMIDKELFGHKEMIVLAKNFFRKSLVDKTLEDEKILLKFLILYEKYEIFAEYLPFLEGFYSADIHSNLIEINIDGKLLFLSDIKCFDLIYKNKTLFNLSEFKKNFYRLLLYLKSTNEYDKYPVDVINKIQFYLKDIEVKE